MVKIYIKPEMKSLDGLHLTETIGPGQTQYGQINLDIFRGSAMLEKTSEYRLAKNTSTEIYNIKNTAQEVLHG